jgi:hypothetical protein
MANLCVYELALDFMTQIRSCAGICDGSSLATLPSSWYLVLCVLSPETETALGSISQWNDML